MRASFLRKESYEERSWNYNNYPSYSYNHQHPISSLDNDCLHHDNRRIHHDDGTLCWCGTIHVNKTTTLLKKKDAHQDVLGSKPILRPPLAYQPHHYKTTTYYGGGGGGGAYEYDKFIGDRHLHHQFHGGGALEHFGFIDWPHQHHQLGGGAAYEYDRFIDRSHQHSSEKGHMEGFGASKANLDGRDLEETSHELESLIKDMELNGRGRGGGVKVIELVQIERTRTYGRGFRKQWKTSSTYRPSNGQIFSMNY